MAEPMALYNFNFTSFNLTSVRFDLVKKDGGSISTGDIDVNPELSANYSLSGPTHCDILVSVKVTDPRAPFNFFIQGVAGFDFNQEIEMGEHFDKIAKVNLLSIAFPFVREAIAEITRRMGVAPFLLPPVNFIEMYKVMATKEKPVIEGVPEQTK